MGDHCSNGIVCCVHIPQPLPGDKGHQRRILVHNSGTSSQTCVAAARRSSCMTQTGVPAAPPSQTIVRCHGSSECSRAHRSFSRQVYDAAKPFAQRWTNPFSRNLTGGECIHKPSGELVGRAAVRWPTAHLPIATLPLPCYTSTTLRGAEH
jgi:hypothetical protein